MIEKILIDADKLFNKLTLNTIAVYSTPSNKCCLSCHSDDDLAYVCVESKDDGYIEKEYAIRNWNIMHSILSSFYSPETNNNFKIKIELDAYSYPSLMRISNGKLKMVHYLQNFTFLEKQADLLSAYKGKKIYLKSFDGDGNCFINEEMMRDIVKLGGLLNEKFFRIINDENGIIIAYGNENQSIDSGTLQISETPTSDGLTESLFFSIEYFSSMFRALADQNVKIKLFNDKIVMIGENDISRKVAILRGKNI